MFTFSFSSSSSSLVLVFFDYENDEEDDDDSNFNSTTQGKSAGISSELAKLQITRGDFDVFFPANLKNSLWLNTAQRCSARQRASPALLAKTGRSRETGPPQNCRPIT